MEIVAVAGAATTPLITACRVCSADIVFSLDTDVCFVVSKSVDKMPHVECAACWYNSEAPPLALLPSHPDVAMDAALARPVRQRRLPE